MNFLEDNEIAQWAEERALPPSRFMGRVSNAWDAHVWNVSESGPSQSEQQYDQQHSHHGREHGPHDVPLIPS